MVRTYLRAVWPVSGPIDDLVVSTAFAVLSPGPDLDARYFAWVAQSDPFVNEVVARSKGVAYPAATIDDIGDITLRVPRLGNQGRIASFLDQQTARLDELIFLLGGSGAPPGSSLSGLLLERRQALVTAAVTGQLDIPGVAA